MARFTRIQVLQTMMDTGLVPLFFNADIEICKKLATACYEGGARILEFTNRGDFAYDAFNALSKYCASELPELILGAGSIVDPPTAALYIQSGANFIVSASIREDVALLANRRKIPYLPGCGSLTEIGKAEELGCEIVKLFPGSVYGPGFIKAIRGPQPWTSIMPTGGVSTDHENLKSWFDAGVCCVGMGSKLISKDREGNYDYKRITELTRSTLELINNLRAI